MRVLSKLVLAAVALGALTTTASAAVNITSGGSFNGVIPATETLVWDFDAVANSNFSFTPAIAGTNVHIGSAANQWAAPAFSAVTFDPSHYGIASVGDNSTFAIKSGSLTSLSLLIGSLDDYNTIKFIGNGVSYTFTGTQLAADCTGGCGAAANHLPSDPASNLRFVFGFDKADDITSVVFSTTKPAFEFDNIAASWVSTVPEPATWAMMILGFGFVGFMMRSSRQKAAAVIA